MLACEIETSASDAYRKRERLDERTAFTEDSPILSEVLGDKTPRHLSSKESLFDVFIVPKCYNCPVLANSSFLISEFFGHSHVGCPGNNKGDLLQTA